MKRIDVTRLAPLTRDVLRAWTVGSWRDDAYDPATDGPRPVRVKPAMVLADGTKIYPAWFDDVSDGLHGDLDNWA